MRNVGKKIELRVEYHNSNSTKWGKSTRVVGDRESLILKGLGGRVTDG